MNNNINPAALPVSSLYKRCDPAELPFSNTGELDHLDKYFGQERAVEALNFGVSIAHEGYNIFVLGPSGMGKHHMVSDFIRQIASEHPAPSDWCYVNNFEAPHQPKVLTLPAGMARQLEKSMEQCIEDLLVSIPAVFQSAEYKTRVNQINNDYSEKEQRALSGLEEKAKRQNISLIQTPTGYTLAPMVDGKVITHDEFRALSEEEQKHIETITAELKEELKKIVMKMPVWMKEGREQLKELNHEIVESTVKQVFQEQEQHYQDLPEVISFLKAAEQDIIENINYFKIDEDSTAPTDPKSQAKAFPMYTVNVLIDNSQSSTAPVIYENNPSLTNLLGRVEHEAQYGTLTTNFTLIKAGALHRANGGYLLLDALKLLTSPYAWDALKRALQSKEIKIESVSEILSLASTKSLEPQPVPLDLKIILLGDRLIYHLLQAYDPDFNQLFKVPADLSEDIDRTSQNSLKFARLIATIQQKEKLRPLDREAVARIIEEGSRRLEDAQKLSLHLNNLTDLICESDFFATQDESDIITRAHVQKAIDAAIRRLDQFKERVHESIIRDIQLVDTDGDKVAQVNGLSVYQLGEYSFGRPSRITAKARLGSGKVLDIERAVKLGGNIHSKAVMILSSLLANRYARNKPLPISASLVFEQSYGGVEGDSASIAEFCALISAIANIPVKQSLAVTGSLNQHGQAQAIGGINQKIEGYFAICSARGLTGRQGVLMPQANIQHLMLKQDVIDAVEKGMFHIYAVQSIDDALTLLMGMPAGEEQADGSYPNNSINARVMAQVDEWIALTKEFSAHSDENDDHDDKD